MNSSQQASIALISQSFQGLQKEVEQIAQALSLRTEGGIRLSMPGETFANTFCADFTLWDLAGVITLKSKPGRYGFNRDNRQDIPLMMRFSFSYNSPRDAETIKQRINEYFSYEAEVHWNVASTEQTKQMDLAIHFEYQPQHDILDAYIRYVLGMITGRNTAA
ncbi:hypothetical protein [Brevibacillus laterosporus]|uniref:hypothetical protein n=1 Tax=Brevibacillus laterosporus TaxID=1465 RepID=UPI0026536287|nr:hypothetical protein [Brevibacillus laterosporus]MDN9011036.1 hypothetical protein [Brevibacillus laterosporus]MDO0942059.1 hypothetical protein [Brevibacillus laterosporus]